MHTVYKPWGKEEWLALNDRYCYKRIYINAGYKTSFQYHLKKIETNYIISGTAEVWLEDDDGVIQKKIMNAGEYFDVHPPKKHRVIAITDIILQEVSTPEVDDVIRIGDEYKRSDGKVEFEHQRPTVLILAAGVGARLGELTKTIPKAMISIKDKPAISHIIEKYPKEFDIVVATGYKSDVIEEYCSVVHSDRNFIFVDVDDYESDISGPGYSALKCKQYLNRPFYLNTCDTIIKNDIPTEMGNWIGVYPTVYSEKYSTVDVSSDGYVLNFMDKSANGYPSAFIGVGYFWNFEIFWQLLENSDNPSNLVSTFLEPSKIPNFKAIELDWYDTGNINGLREIRSELELGKNTQLHKTTSDVIYFSDNSVIKYIADSNRLNNLYNRRLKDSTLLPDGIKLHKNFIEYKLIDGDTLYTIGDVNIYNMFIDKLMLLISNSDFDQISDVHINIFYIDKTYKRIDEFLNKYGNSYLTTEFSINDRKYNTLSSILSRMNSSTFSSSYLYNNFHGDLQFDNIILDSNNNFRYIDWRDSFGDHLLDRGDVYYDLAKLHGGLIISYKLMKDDNNIEINQNGSVVYYDYPKDRELHESLMYFYDTIIKYGYDIDYIKFMTGLIFLNMSSVHDSKFSKLLWFKGIQMLSEYVYK